jgi:uncharacterized iron-regulated membrane protein
MTSIRQEKHNNVTEDSMETDFSKAKHLYKAVWRWHFYAGIIFAPFIIMLAITGSIYLFKPQIENMMYQDYYYVQAGQHQLSPSRQIEEVKKSYPDATITRYKPSVEADRSAEIGILNKDENMTVFVNPYNGEVVGELKDSDKLMNKIEELHGELMMGTMGDRLVELAACWAMILLVTGIYLWWPRNTKSLFGTLIPRFFKGKRIMLRDLHAVPAFWLSLGIAFLILTGLPWSGFWGEQVQKLGTNTGVGYPAAVWWGEKPQSVIPSKDVANVPWAAEQLPVPKSIESKVKPISIDQVVSIADARHIHPGYGVFFPDDPKGVYTISIFPDKSTDEATLHVDQYSGKVLNDYRFHDYGPMAKIIATGITLHKGTHFGLLNRLAGLIVCLGIVSISITGFIMWWKRRPAGKLGAPPLPKDFKMLKWVTVIIVILGIIFPLVGVSLLIVLALDWFVIRRIPTVKQWVG